MPEKFQPKDLIEKPSKLWTAMLGSINCGSNKWADKMFDDTASVLLVELASSLNGYERKFGVRDYVFYAYLGVTRGVPYEILSAIADRTGGRNFHSIYTYKPQ